RATRLAGADAPVPRRGRPQRDAVATEAASGGRRRATRRAGADAPVPRRGRPQRDAVATEAASGGRGRATARAGADAPVPRRGRPQRDAVATMKIAILTSGGDAPGMNAAVRSVVLGGQHRGHEVIGIRRGYEGLLAGELQDFPVGSTDGITGL